MRYKRDIVSLDTLEKVKICSDLLRGTYKGNYSRGFMQSLRYRVAKGVLVPDALIAMCAIPKWRKIAQGTKIEVWEGRKLITVNGFMKCQMICGKYNYITCVHA